MNTNLTALIAMQNDLFRKTGPCWQEDEGQVLLSRGITALPSLLQMAVFAEVRAFNTFTEDNDPYGEHDFGAFELAGAGKVVWKIDYYADASLEDGSDDPANPAQCFRLLTILLASEY